MKRALLIVLLLLAVLQAAWSWYAAFCAGAGPPDTSAFQGPPGPVATVAPNVEVAPPPKMPGRPRPFPGSEGVVPPGPGGPPKAYGRGR
ncbi:MAG: hypothetical protein FJX76_01800 [Armatimonadetes bacterium]|nr:hypothetical protein [Armatimonadota bacterium]